VVQRNHFPLAYESKEHLTEAESAAFESMLPLLEERFGNQHFLVSKSAKDPHRMAKSRVLVRRFNGDLQPMEEASHFIRHLARIERYRIYTSPDLLPEVAKALQKQFD
jgi:Na+-transporting NADH:ubiquinone oxidoreductase subunit NqrA